MRTLALLSLLAAPSALAAEVLLYDGPDDDEVPDVLLPEADWPAWMARGAGAMSLAYDGEAGEWVMIFEARLSEDYLDGMGSDYDVCRAGPDRPRLVWGLGRATSPDGLTDWTIDPEPVLLPAPGSWDACVVAHPRLVPEGDTWHLYYKAEQAWDPCPPDGTEPPPWGCERMTGVGYAASSDAGRSWSALGGDSPPLPVPGGDFGYPSVVAWQPTGAPLDEEQWLMLLTDGTGLRLASSPAPDGPWTLQDEPTLEPGTWLFAESFFTQPSLLCGPEGETFPFVVWLGGQTDGGRSGLDDLRSIDPASQGWLGDGDPAIGWDGALQWRHWEMIRSASGVRAYFTIRDGTGTIRTFAASIADAAPSFDTLPRNAPDRLCLYGERPTDPGDTGDTGPIDTGDTGVDPDPDPDPPASCYCASGGSPGLAWPVGALLGLALLRRRRR